MQDKTDFRLGKLEDGQKCIEDKQDKMDNKLTEIHERVKHTEVGWSKLSELVDEIRINNVTITNFVKRTQSERQLLYGAIVTAMASGVVALIIALIGK